MSLFFGLSGTGKTTLSADPRRRLIGDDEHCWSDDGVFNIEGGCYAKCIDLSPRSRAGDLSSAIRFGAVLENVVYRRRHASGRLTTTPSITENTRGRYPIEFIPNAKIPCVGGHPRNIIFLTCDAFGVLPPVSRLTPDAGDVPLHQRLHGQGGRHRGGRHRAAGDVLGLLRRRVPGLAPDQVRRAAGREDRSSTTAQRLAGQHRLDRRRVRHRLADQAGLHAGDHRRDPRRLAGQGGIDPDPVFGLQIPKSYLPGVPSELLVPENAWKDKEAFQRSAAKLAGLFQENFKKFADHTDAKTVAAGPKA